MENNLSVHAIWRSLKPLTPETKVRDVAVFPTDVLGHLLIERRSERIFSDLSISQEKLDRILVNCCGAVNRMDLGGKKEAEILFRTIPQGGAICSIRLFLVLIKPTEMLDKGIYSFCHCTNTLHRLPNVSKLNERQFKDAMAASEPLDAAAVLIIAGDMETKTYKYGSLGTKLVMIEAGCALQNASLSACDQKISAYAWGRFHDKEMADMLGLSYPMELPLVGMIMGMPLI